jgi:hypothetical protein
VKTGKIERGRRGYWVRMDESSYDPMWVWRPTRKMAERVSRKFIERERKSYREADPQLQGGVMESWKNAWWYRYRWQIRVCAFLAGAVITYLLT